MSSDGAAEPRFRYASDQSLFVDFDGSATDESSLFVARWLRWFDGHPIAGVRNLHPAYNSVLIVFDPVSTSHEQVTQEILAGAGHLDQVILLDPRTVEIPVRYGGLNGPDLDDVAALHGIAKERVVELHSSAVYTVPFLGFVPGFAYLSGLPAELATPRLAVPRTNVPAGSVGIAGNQTAVYPFLTPGGWRLIGRTDARMFETDRPQMSLLQIGDRVRFIPA